VLSKLLKVTIYVRVALNPPLMDLLQKVPLGKLSFFACVISPKCANQQKQLCNDAFHVKTSQPAKNQPDSAKYENRPKKQYTPFLHEILQIIKSILHLSFKPFQQPFL